MRSDSLLLLAIASLAHGACGRPQPEHLCGNRRTNPVVWVHHTTKGNVHNNWLLLLDFSGFVASDAGRWRIKSLRAWPAAPATDHLFIAPQHSGGGDCSTCSYIQRTPECKCSTT